MENATENVPNPDQTNGEVDNSNNNENHDQPIVTGDKNDDKYYQDAKKYWSTISPTVDGMLGGFGNISFTDIRGSDQFLKNMFKLKPAPGRLQALDCGAGIGRISKNLLMTLFERVDLVEQDAQFCATAERDLRPTGKLGTVYNVGLQEFCPEDGKYDLIWAQWVLGHLTDGDIVEFFFRCTKALKKNGMMVIKENFTNTDAVELDRRDSSVTRPLHVMKQLLTKGNLRVVKEQRQKDFPKGQLCRKILLVPGLITTAAAAGLRLATRFFMTIAVSLRRMRMRVEVRHRFRNEELSTSMIGKGSIERTLETEVWVVIDDGYVRVKATRHYTAAAILNEVRFLHGSMPAVCTTSTNHCGQTQMIRWEYV